MIPRDYVTAWRAQVPWVQDFQVEQDLIIRLVHGIDSGGHFYQRTLNWAGSWSCPTCSMMRLA